MQQVCSTFACTFEAYKFTSTLRLVFLVNRPARGLPVHGVQRSTRIGCSSAMHCKTQSCSSGPCVIVKRSGLRTGTREAPAHATLSAYIIAKKHKTVPLIHVSLPIVLGSPLTSRVPTIQPLGSHALRDTHRTSGRLSIQSSGTTICWRERRSLYRYSARPDNFSNRATSLLVHAHQDLGAAHHL